jgi:hypothetical protein
MTTFRDDDDIHRARMVYLGPPGWNLPFHLPYAQYGIGAVLTAVYSAVLILLTGNPIWIGLALGLAILSTQYLWRYVDPDRNARTVIRTAVLDRKSVQPPTGEEQLPTLVARITVHPAITRD